MKRYLCRLLALLIFSILNIPSFCAAQSFNDKAPGQKYGYCFAIDSPRGILHITEVFGAVSTRHEEQDTCTQHYTAEGLTGGDQDATCSFFATADDAESDRRDALSQMAPSPNTKVKTMITDPCG
jgi:hypothetical protein